MLGACASTLWDAYDLAILDLDGVVYVGRDAVPGAAKHLAAARAAGMRLAFVTTTRRARRPSWPSTSPSSASRRAHTTW